MNLQPGDVIIIRRPYSNETKRVTIATKTKVVGFDAYTYLDEANMRVVIMPDQIVKVEGTAGNTRE